MSLFSLGKISGSKVAKLKASYRLLQDTLKRSQESEIQLLGEAKRSRSELQGLQAQVDGAKEQLTSMVPDTEVSQLRQQLLQVYNDLNAAEDREYNTQFKLECLQEEKLCLEKEYETQPKLVELESRMKAQRDRCEDLRKEVEQRRLEIRSLKKDMESREMQILREQKELEGKKEIVDIKQAEMAQLLTVPNQLFKEIERMSRRKADATKKAAALDREMTELKEQLKEVDQHNRALEEERKEVMKELEGHRAQVEATEREHRILLKDQQSHKEREVVLMGDRGLLEMKIMEIGTDSKLLYESQAAQLREKDRQMQTLKRMERTLKLASENMEQTQSLFNKIKAQTDAVPKREASLQRRDELQKEVDALKIKLKQQQTITEEESQKEQQEVVQELLCQSNLLQEELRNLSALTQIKTNERDEKHRELHRAEQMNQHIKQELRAKDLTILERKKVNTVLQHRLSQYAKMYDIIREEKNKYVSLKHIASQRIEEMTEEFNIRDNEAEILHTAAIKKDRMLTKARLKLFHSRKLRDSLRNDISKVAWKLLELGHQCEEHQLEVAKVTHMIDSQERALLDMTKRHDAAIQRRNDLGIQVLEREEEVCIFYEKVNVQESTMAEGNMALEALEEEMRGLQLAIRMERRQTELRKQQVPLKRKLQEQVATLQIELSEAQDRTSELGKALQDPTHQNRSRELTGTDPTSVELVKRIEQLEVRLADCEEQLLEKELLLDQVTRLSQPIREKAENGHLERLALAKKVNELRSRINDDTRRMMSLAAELSMKQATALHLQQEITEKQLQVDVCQQRLEQGLSPCAEMEEEWRRALRDKRRRQRDKQERERLAEEEERSQHTTAKTRPSAYIPEADCLPLPKPYGALAPFKPTEPGANIRHIRKPKPKPIET
ncbi:coiled-coil domain-containing protein 146 [Polymixia lowei]